MESVEIIQWCLDHLNYLTITLLMAIESSFIPFPSEVVVPPAAYRAASATSDMNVVLVVVFATLGAILGSLINYGLAYFLGRPVVYKFANSRLGHMCLLDREKVEIAEHYFNKHGKIATFTGRLIPAVRQLISIPAGLALEHGAGSHRLRSGCCGSGGPAAGRGQQVFPPDFIWHCSRGGCGPGLCGVQGGEEVSV